MSYVLSGKFNIQDKKEGQIKKNIIVAEMIKMIKKTSLSCQNDKKLSAIWLYHLFLFLSCSGGPKIFIWGMWTLIGNLILETNPGSSYGF